MRQRDGEDAQAREEHLEEQGEVIPRGELVIRVSVRSVKPAENGHPQRVRKPDGGGDGDRAAAPAARQHKIEDQRKQEKTGQRGDRCDLA